MKHSLTAKFLAILLAAFSLVSAFGGGVGIVAMESAGLYVNGLDELQAQEYKSISAAVAHSYAELYAVNHLGNLPNNLKKMLYTNPADRGDAEYWCVKLQQGDAVLVDPGPVDAYTFVKTYTVTPQYPIVSYYITSDSSSPEATTPTESTESSEGTETNVPEGYLYTDRIRIWEDNWLAVYDLYYYEAPQYTVTVYMQEGVLESSSVHILTSIYPHRYDCIALLAVSLVVFAACLVFLFWSAGTAPGGEIRPGGLNRIPLDIYALVAVGGIALLTVLFFKLCNWMDYGGPHPGNLSLIGVNLLVITLLGIGLLFAFAAQIKLKNGYWWRHSVIGWCCVKVGRFIRKLWRGFKELISLLPVIWQWLLTAVCMVLSTVITFVLYICAIGQAFFAVFFFLLFLLDLAVCTGIILYGGYAFGTLMKGVRKMNEGDLSCKIPTKHLHGSFLDFARQLNALSETAKIAAENEMKSERMKSELITNVSHDIKTPLTSIINFVDLLRKPHTQEEGEQYLEVLQRQSERMKKLIEDLMELSKANTGNITVNIVRMDAVETVNQALGEFSDKLAAVGLVPVFRQPAEPILMEADGRLVWRVLSNLLGNAVKYAMPGTRLYIDLMRAEDQVLLSLKNVSREELNINADELMERFVRGDAARNSEGSGLGLNIAKSLMEVQNGQLRLLLDGDLFKVTLIFPAV
ncbi:MAG: HAMP domain-containing histidine kinase [Oscillospiraceae bacterium]|nr:HAMP domain-containing histidine kinase [Oscillospiraceae bacterium]